MKPCPYCGTPSIGCLDLIYLSYGVSSMCSECDALVQNSRMRLLGGALLGALCFGIVVWIFLAAGLASVMWAVTPFAVLCALMPALLAKPTRCPDPKPCEVCKRLDVAYYGPGHRVCAGCADALEADRLARAIEEAIDRRERGR